jgi:hypothetical protein
MWGDLLKFCFEPQAAVRQRFLIIGMQAHFCDVCLCHDFSRNANRSREIAIKYSFRKFSMWIDT